MSLQTGEKVPEAPASQGFVDRTRFRIDTILKDPNPIWMRELRQSARLNRTPYVLMSVAIVTTLIIAGVGSGLGDTAPSDVMGQVLFQTFFSLAYFIVLLTGPSVAANTIASEREGRTWEAIILTGMSPKTIARGKFLAAFTALASYVVMLAPVGALSFLFGGVDSLEVLIGFIYLFVLALIAVSLGLALSSKMTSSRGAILVTLFLSVPIAGMVWGICGSGFSFLAHRLWPRVPEGVPMWLPLAYVRGEPGWQYVLILFVLPVVVIGLPTWFLYESTIANLTEPTDDRSTGLKRWFLVAIVALTIAGLVPALFVTNPADCSLMLGADMVCMSSFLLFCAFVFMGEPLGASRRIRHRWTVEGASALRRWLGPSLERTFKMVLVAGVASLGLILLVSILNVIRLTPPPLSAPWDRFAVHGAYMIGLFVFTTGLGMYLRSRSHNLFGSRLVFAVILGGLLILPWMVAALAGIAFRGSGALILGSPSPVFGVMLLGNVPDEVSIAGIVVAVAWTVIGLFLVVQSVRRSRLAVAQFEEHLARADAVLAAEDAMAESRIAAPS